MGRQIQREGRFWHIEIFVGTCMYALISCTQWRPSLLVSVRVTTSLKLIKRVSENFKYVLITL